jgi:magnesium-protoporphyrin IX monomethyl ester (oxidative) cyclase
MDDSMRVLFVHPGPLLYSEIFLRLEPLGLERVASAARFAGHDVRVVDLQVCSRAELEAELQFFRPEAVGFGLNYLANVPEVLELGAQVKRRLPQCFTFAGGHSVSFIAPHVLDQAEGGLDAIVRGDGEVIIPLLLQAARDGAAHDLPGVVTHAGEGKGPPLMLDSIDDCPPARDLMRKRRRYFIGELDPCASIEFTRGCPWDCSFCSAWTFYGRAYRKASPQAAAAELEAIHEPNVFIVDDVAFIRADHGEEIARQVERRRIHKRYYLETRADVLLRNTDVFERWRRLGLTYMFLGIEALDEHGLELYRKRVNTDTNMKALEQARRLGIEVAINLIVDPQWDERQFELVREFALSVPEIVHLTVITPYPGTELWHSESQKLTTRDYRLFDIQHAVLPTKLPLERFYEELVHTQAVINRKFLGFRTAVQMLGIISRQLAHGQTNFVQMLWKFNKVYNPKRQYSDHFREVRYELPVPEHRHIDRREREQLYIHRRPSAVGGGGHHAAAAS